MPVNYPNHVQCQAILKQVQALICQQAPAAQVSFLEVFLQRYYGGCALEDLKQHSIEDLYHILLSHWNYIFQRKPGEQKVRVFNPEKEKDGWHSIHTVIQTSYDDIPFLVDSIRMVLNRYDYQIHFIIHMGGWKVKRDKQNYIIDPAPHPSTKNNYTTESPIYIEIDHLSHESSREALRSDLERVLSDVHMAVVDWMPMVQRVEECLLELEKKSLPLEQDEIAESCAFLKWLMNNHFTFIGARDYKLIGDGKNRALQAMPGSGLGVLREDALSKAAKSYAELPPQARKMALSKNILIIAKTNTKSTIHRSAYTDYVGIKQFNQKGELIGERRFIGLYTSTAYHVSPRYIPILRQKINKVIQSFHFPSDSHGGKEVVHILETLPRDDLLQASEEELFELTEGILHLQERKRIRLFVRRDAYYRYFSCFVYVPREIFNTELAIEIQEYLMRAFKGIESEFTTYFSDSVLARIHYLVRVHPNVSVEYDVSELEQELIIIARTWSDELHEELIKYFGESTGLQLYARYHKAFPGSYTEYYLPLEAIDDIKQIESLSEDNPLGMLFYQSRDQDQETLRLKLFHMEETIALSDVLPTLENMGLRILGERPHEIRLKGKTKIWINDFDMVYITNKKIDINAIKKVFQDAFTKIWSRLIEDDRFNRLILEASLTWQEIQMLRAYTKYLNFLPCQ